jgi:hypothetical protein
MPPNRLGVLMQALCCVLAAACHTCSYQSSRSPASRLPACRRTEEGYAIYSETELGLAAKGGGGSSDKCPFDCECCF